ncbi:MAG TPA: hypothetical protein VGL56_18670 [Fimbriimonadaceae bacterium]|jgi:hypothetical protein
MISLRLGAKLAAALGVAFLGHSVAVPHQTAVASQLHVLIVGGGPDPQNNQVAIESNVRYVARLLPADTSTRILFANGNPKAKNVQWEDDNGKKNYREPDLPRLDGPSELYNVKQEISTIADSAQTNPQNPVLLYFTGHGSPNTMSRYQNNQYDLWNDQILSVKDFSSSLAKFPSTTPIAVVMVECFSGSFGNILFQNGDPNGAPTQSNICGFFASVDRRMAAGCTPEIHEKNYKDFTGYFFAALTGMDRMGQPVAGADYNHDGKIGMSEAYCYSLIHDDSIDTPVCTSDVFLRRFVKLPDKEVMATPFSRVVSWATPGQSAALNALSDDLHLSGEDRLGQAYDKFLHSDPQSEELSDVRLIRFVRLAKSVVLAHTMETNPDTALKARFDQLIKAEASDPLKP